MYNEWDENDKGLQLAMSLDGEALGILADLSGREQRDFYHLKAALLNRYAPPGREARFELELYNRTMQRHETAVTYGGAIRKLAREAYPDVSLDERILCGLYIRGLKNTETKRFVHLQGPANLNEAIRLATTFDTFEEASVEKGVLKKPKMETLNKVTKGSGEAVQSTGPKALLPTGPVTPPPVSYPPPGTAPFSYPPAPNTRQYNAPGPRGPVVCWNCEGTGHFSRDCPAPRRPFNPQGPSYFRVPSGGPTGPFQPHHQGGPPNHSLPNQGPGGVAPGAYAPDGTQRFPLN